MSEFIDSQILEDLIRATSTESELRTLLTLIEKYRTEAKFTLSISDYLLLKTIDKMLDRIEGREKDDTNTAG